MAQFIIWKKLRHLKRALSKNLLEKLSEMAFPRNKDLSYSSLRDFIREFTGEPSPTTFLPFRYSNSMRTNDSWTLAPACWIRSMAARRVPPVANRSSITRTRSFGPNASLWISTMSWKFEGGNDVLEIFWLKTKIF